MRRRDRRKQSLKGDMLSWALEMSDVLWPVLTFVLRIPALLLRLLT